MSREIVTAKDVARTRKAHPAPGRVVVDRVTQPTGPASGPPSDLARAMPSGARDETAITIRDPGLPTGAVKPDDYTARLLKYVPAEVIALYLTLNGVVQAVGRPRPDLLWLVFAIGLVATPIYLWRVGKVSKSLQLAIATGAFVVWVLAIGGPFNSIPLDPIYGAILLPVYTFAVAIIEP